MAIVSGVACLRRALRVIVSMFSQGVMIRINACTHILFVIVLGLVSISKGTVHVCFLYWSVCVCVCVFVLVRGLYICVACTGQYECVWHTFCLCMQCHFIFR